MTNKNINQQLQETVEEVHTPIDTGKKTLEEIFEECSKALLALDFMSNASLKGKPCEYLLPKANKFFYQKWNRTFLVEV